MLVRRAELSNYDAHLIGLEGAGHVDQHDDTGLELVDIEGEFIRAAFEVYQSLAIAYDRDLNPWEKICEEASCELVSTLHPSIDASVVHYSGDDSHSEEDHFFVIAEFDGYQWLVDPTYMQFLEREDRLEAGLNPVMIIRLPGDVEHFEEELSSWGIAEEDYHYWTSVVYGESN